MTKKTATLFFVLIFCCTTLVSIALADDQDRTRDRKRDGSCQTDLNTQEAMKLLAADQTRDRKGDWKRDGSCQG